MEEMEKKLQDFENNDDEALKSRISELEIELEAKENQLKQASESNVRKRVLELELLLDEQSNIYMALLKEKSDLKEQLIKITREREKLIDSYEAQVEGMEKALRDKIFAVEETKHLDEINDLKLKREADQREILDLKTKLEISEKTRSSVQETTLVILKQAQEESAKIAMAHHERSLKSFLSEIRAETGQKSRQDEELEAQLSEALSMIEKLQKTNFDLECSNASLSDQVKTLTADLASLQEAKSNLETIIKDSKTSWPPSQQTFEGLKERIRELESASNKRESDIVQLLEESRISVSQELAQEKRDLLNILNRKDAEIISFKEELESLMGMIIKLKNEKF
jgi:chromosome segregation ATPase